MSQVISRTIRTNANGRGGQFFARIRYRDSNGYVRELLRKADNKTDAKQKLVQLESEILTKGTKQLEAGRVTFSQLADYVKENYYVAASYDEHDSKIAGVRSVKPAHTMIDNLTRYFGDIDIKKIDGRSLEKYKLSRLTAGVKIATSNRELAKARRMFKIAVAKHWLSSNPFDSEEFVKGSLISVSSEKGAKERVLTEDEEAKLFKALQHKDRRHTIPVFIAALETGARYSSLVEFLKWKHVNFKTEELTITTYKDKNMKQWEVPISNRLKAELLKLKLQTGADPESLVFAESAVNLRKVWEAARDIARLDGVRFHDLRHTFATRMAEAGMPVQELAKILGHTDIKMTFRYYHLTKNAKDKAREILNRRAAVNG